MGEGQLTSIEASLCGQSRLSISSYGSTYSVPDVSLNNNMTIGPRRLSSAVVPTYHLSFMFSGLLHIIVVMTLHTDITYSFSVTNCLSVNSQLATQISLINFCKRIPMAKKIQDNIAFTFNFTFCLSLLVLRTWLFVLLMSSGDIHPNPGPMSSVSSISSSTSSTSLSASVFDSLSLSHHLSFVHYNVQSILSKLDILHAELIDFDILAFTETWLSQSTSTEDLHLDTYCKPERKDRPTDAHGGILVYIKENIHFRRRHDLEPQGIECLWIEVENKSKHILFGVFYRPPNSDSIYYGTIEDSIHLAVDTGINDIIITGDFNLNVLNNPSFQKVQTLCNQFALHQSINEPTHFTEHSSSSIDLILVSNKDHLVLSGVGDPFLNQEVRYHCPIYGVFKFSKPKHNTYTRHIWSYDRGNYELLRQKATNTDWNSLHDTNIHLYSQNITNCIISLAKECIPNKTIRIRPSDPPWITTHLKQYIRKRKRAYKQAKRTNLPAHWSKFKKLRNKTIAVLRNSKKAFFDKLSEKLKSETLSSRDWWATLKHIINQNSRSQIPPLESNGHIFTDDKDKANLLNTFFQNQTILNDQHATLPPLIHITDSRLSSIILSPIEVKSVLKSLATGKASGPNGLNNRILKELATEISVPLCNLFNLSLQEGIVPDSYKEGNVCSILKKDDPSQPSNYRPVTLLNSEDKVFERLVFKYLYNHLIDNNILTSLQSGFMPGDSTVNQLTYLYNTICQALDQGKEVRAVFCDISKAFDRVWHAGLIHKLQAAGVCGSVLNWFKNYLSNRKQRVVLPGITSDWVYILAGVPQGSILGPLLFLLYINDIVNDIGANIRLFADDTSLSIIVENPVMAAACLNTDLLKLTHWAATWLVLFNPTKTESLIFSRKLNKPLHPPLFMENQQIVEVESHKHLGVILSADCTWHKHIKYITDKAWVRINIMRRLKFKLDRKSLEIIYTTFIRPLLEYSDVIWDNCTRYEKQELDKIQNEAA